MRYAKSIYAPTTQLNALGLDIVALALCCDDDSAVVGIYLHTLKPRCGNRIVGLTRAVGIYTHHREYGPCRHRSRIVIPGQTIRGCRIVCIEKLANILLRKMRAPLHAAKQVGVGYIGLVRRVVIAALEHFDELRHKALLAPHNLNQPLNIVGHEEGVVPRATLMEAHRIGEVCARRRVERLDKMPLLIDRAHHAILLAEVVAPPRSSAPHLSRKLLIAHLRGEARKGIIRNVVLQGVRHGVISRHIGSKPPHRDVTSLNVWVDIGAYRVAIARRRCRPLHSAIGSLDIEVAQTLQVAIHNNGYCRVSLHCEGLAAIEFPARQPSPLLGHRHHRMQHIALTLRIYQRKQLMQIAIGIPQREYRISLIAHSHPHIATLHRGVLAIDIAEQIGVQQGVV